MQRGKNFNFARFHELIPRYIPDTWRFVALSFSCHSTVSHCVWLDKFRFQAPASMLFASRIVPTTPRASACRVTGQRQAIKPFQIHRGRRSLEVAAQRQQILLCRSELLLQAFLLTELPYRQLTHEIVRLRTVHALSFK